MYHLAYIISSKSVKPTVANWVFGETPSRQHGQIEIQSGVVIDRAIVLSFKFHQTEV